MKNKNFIISLFFFIGAFTSIFAIDYQVLKYWNLVDLSGVVYPPGSTIFQKDDLDTKYIENNLDIIKNKFKELLLNYHPDKSENFIQRDFFEKYSKVLTQAKNQLINNKKGSYLTNEEIKEKIIFDFYLLMRKQVKQGSLNSVEIQTFFNSLLQATRIDTSDLKLIITGILDAASNRDLSGALKNRLLLEENKLNTELVDILPANEKKIKTAIIKTFFYSYLSKKIRDTSVEALIKLSRVYKNQRNTGNAKEVLKQTNNIIETEWGTVFPIDNKYKGEIASLLSELEVAEIPTTVLEEVRSLLQRAAGQFDPSQFNVSFGQAIEKLKPSLPTSAPNILEVYLKWSEKFIPTTKAYTLYLALLDASKFEADAQTKNFPMPTMFADKKSEVQQVLEAISEENRNAAKESLKQRKPDASQLEKINALIDGAKVKETQEAVKNYLQAIEWLRFFIPEKSAEIINTYLEIIKKYKDTNELDSAKKFVKIAQNQAKSLGLVTEYTSEFEQAIRDLNSKAAEVGVPPIPARPPATAPSKALGELNQIFIDLQTELAKLKALID